MAHAHSTLRGGGVVRCPSLPLATSQAGCFGPLCALALARPDALLTRGDATVLALPQHSTRAACLQLESMLLDMDGQYLVGGRDLRVVDLTRTAQCITAGLGLGDLITVDQSQAAYHLLMRAHAQESASGGDRVHVFTAVDLAAPGVHPVFFMPSHTAETILAAGLSGVAPERFAVQHGHPSSVLVLYKDRQGTARVPFVGDEVRRAFLHSLLGVAQPCTRCGATVEEVRTCFNCGDSVCIACHRALLAHGVVCRLCATASTAQPGAVAVINL